MAKRVFFSFHYHHVIDFRTNVVKQHWLTQPDKEDASFFDADVRVSVGNLSKIASPHRRSFKENAGSHEADCKERGYAIG